MTKQRRANPRQTSPRSAPEADGATAGAATARPGDARPIEPGLYFVATPIGAARDITLRALDLLAGADVLVAEDTRTLRHLMDIHGIPLGARPLVSYHDHSGPAAQARLLEYLAAGRRVAYASEAGTPLVADPGFELGRAAIAAGYPVFAAPGPSAVLAALTVSGLPTDRFLFAGFPPTAAGARKRMLQELALVKATLVICESPRRINRTLAELVQIFGGDREAAVCRELTKRFEEVRRGSLADLAAAFAQAPVKGEIVLVIDRGASTGPQVGSRAGAGEEAGPGTGAALESELRAGLATGRVKDVAAGIAQRFGLSRRDVYQRALAIARQDGKEQDGKEGE